uniref:Uncharacterized protein n=1 Tax=Meloidogyne enterolobii TaxID=390850 RepID=A0A6V7ULV7_MELEN|nr:unnamed protein product [Meloidogyne enterolobii]
MNRLTLVYNIRMFETITFLVKIKNMEQLKNFKSSHLHEKLRLSDNDFDAWLEELGLLHGKRTCGKCGGRTTIKINPFFVNASYFERNV